MSFSSDNSVQTNQIPRSLDLPEATDKSFNDLLTGHLKRIGDSVNTKEDALYLTQETANFKQLYTKNNPQMNRNGYRTVLDLVALNGGNIGAGAAVSFPHGITGILGTLIIYANCTSVTPKYFSIMNQTVYLNQTNVFFTNPEAAALTQCDVVAEYVKQAR